MDTSSLTLAAPAAIIAFVKALRDSVPKIDGLMVLGASIVVGAGLAYLLSETGEPVKQWIAQGAFWGLSGSGFMAIADRISPPAK